MLNIQTAYIDTCVWISYLLGPEHDKRYYKLAQYVMNKIKNREITSVVSNFVLTELLNSLRRIIGGDFGTLKKLSDDNRQNYVKNTSYEKFKGFMNEMTTLPVGTVIFSGFQNIDANSQIFTPTLRFTSEYFGVVRMFNSCSHCKRKERDNFVSVYKALGPGDFIHILLALDRRCARFITFDKGFNSLVGDPRFEQIKIEVLSP